MYTVVESFGRQLLRAPDGSEYHLACLVEDVHGIRMLLATDLVPEAAWMAAVSGGAQGLIRVTRQGFSFTTLEQFAKHRSENTFARAFELADRHWMAVDWGLDYPSLLRAYTDRYASAEDPFAQLHTHTEFSAFDGYQSMEEYAQRLTEIGQRHMPVTDHGICSGHPQQQWTAAEFGLHPVFGMEAYFVNDRFSREGDKYDYWHLLLWAQDDEGLKNLWALSTESYRDGFWQYPKIDWDSLRRLNSGLLVSTACLRGPLAEPFLQGQEEQALANLARLGDIFGDRLYVELQTTHLEDQAKVNNWLVGVASRTGVPMIAAADAHYARKEQVPDHKLWIASRTSDKETDLFSASDYYLHTIDEVRSALSYLPDDIVEKAIANTTTVAESCTAEIRPQSVTPVYSKPTAEHPDPIKHDAERFMDLVLAGLQNRVLDKGLDPAPHIAKIEHEGPLLLRKGFAGYFLICAEFVTWAKDRGIRVGPGRGSGGASECAWLMRITELDPVEGNLLIDRFLTEGRTELPDFDIDFPSSHGEEVIAHVQERWGKEHVARVGSVMRLQNRGSFKAAQRALANRLPGESFAWVNTISKIVDQAEASTAGLGLSWDELTDQVGDLLQPFQDKMPELFRVAREFHDRIYGYGKHSAGFIIDPDHDLEAELPMRRGDEKEDGTAPMITQWDMDALSWIGKVKFDMLRLRNLDTIQRVLDQIEQDTGREIDPYEWTEAGEYSDPQVFEQLAQGWTLGVFQVETPLGTRVTRQLKPRSRRDLMNIITIGRPGPLRSGLDRIYLRRREGLEPVSYPDPRLESVLADTFGVMLYQEDIMGTCKVLAGYNSDEADEVRKILGKKKVEKVEAAGRKFIERAVANHTNRQVAFDLWEQMKEFAKYSFNKAHAYAYATVALWTAWPKAHYPRQSLTQTMATVEKDRIPQFVAEARRLGYSVLPPDINASEAGFSADGLEIRYGFASIPYIGKASAAAIIEGQPYADYDDFLARRGKACDMGVVKRLVAIGAFDSLHPNRRALEARVLDEATGESDRCALYDAVFQNKYNQLPCHFDWDSEPKKYGRPNKSGERKLLKNQPVIPTACRRKACRQYRPKPQADYSHLPNYSDEQIREREVDTLGVFLTSSPFDIIPDAMINDFETADGLAVMDSGAYKVAVVVLSARPDSKNRDFAFADLLTPSGQLSVIIWGRDWDRYAGVMNKGTLAFAEIIKSADDRYRLGTFVVLK
jgi:DNA polymerase-3 subunit alpha